MLFIDLDKIKVISSYNFITKEIHSTLDITNASISAMKEAFEEGVKKMFNEPFSQVETCFTYVLPGFKSTVADKNEAEAFLTAVNILVATFFKYITLDDGRKREHRLDIPDRLSCVNMSKGTLKKALNHQTRIQKFNIKIIYKDLIFLLVDSKDVPEKEFVHSIDELEENHA